MSTTDYRALCAELLDELELWSSWHDATDLKDRAGAALDLAQPVAEGPTDAELEEEFGTALLRLSGINMNATAVAFARAVLARWGSPTPQPVAYTERLQAVEALAADAVSGLRYIEQTHGRLYGVGWDRVFDAAAKLPPANALPTPEDKP
jgi:hypothetical protein